MGVRGALKVWPYCLRSGQDAMLKAKLERHRQKELENYQIPAKDKQSGSVPGLRVGSGNIGVERALTELPQDTPSNSAPGSGAGAGDVGLERGLIDPPQPPNEEGESVLPRVEINQDNGSDGVYDRGHDRAYIPEAEGKDRQKGLHFVVPSPPDPIMLDVYQKELRAVEKRIEDARRALEQDEVHAHTYTCTYPMHIHTRIRNPTRTGKCSAGDCSRSSCA